MLQYMLDSDTCIYIGKASPSKLVERFNRVGNQICISTITLAELFYGVENSGRRAGNLETLDGLVGRLTVLPFSADAASHYGQICVELQKAGTPIGPYDMLIGAHARAEGLVLVTNNEREFRRITGLRVENWI
ncbi:MAG: type II toxin-antitoxin system VapC family toxin [Alphaproteobacteria bacterium]|nr:type II toxin-antitoxin system VapC family toxin [Alphaproteobacteria bacterium]